MKKILSVSVGVFLTLSLLTGVLQATDLSQIMDKFYAGLADIIERNMDNPQTCLKEVEGYYRSNQGTINQMRQAFEKAMEEAAPVMEQYRSLSAEELEALEREQKDKGQAEISSGIIRYNRALQAFAVKYPQQGMQIATKALELVSVPVKGRR